VGRMKTIAFFAICIAIVLAQTPTPPKISNDFQARVELFEEHGNHNQRFRGMLYEDYTRQRNKLVLEQQHDHGAHVEIYRFYKTKDEYEVTDFDQDCNHRTLNNTMHAAFSWVLNGAVYVNRECHSKFRSGAIGQLWSKKDSALTASLCVNKTNTADPYWMDIKFNNKREGRLIHFERFIPGPPPNAAFILPTVCNFTSAL